LLAYLLERPAFVVTAIANSGLDSDTITNAGAMATEMVEFIAAYRFKSMADLTADYLTSIPGPPVTMAAHIERITGKHHGELWLVTAKEDHDSAFLLLSKNARGVQNRVTVRGSKVGNALLVAVDVSDFEKQTVLAFSSFDFNQSRGSRSAVSGIRAEVLFQKLFGSGAQLGVENVQHHWEGLHGSAVHESFREVCVADSCGFGNTISVNACRTLGNIVVQVVLVVGVLTGSSVFAGRCKHGVADAKLV
jgi:hypothetical protein